MVKFTLTPLFISSFAALVWAANAASLVLHESREAAPHGFSRRAGADGNTVLDMKMSLVQSNIKGLEDRFSDVSNPSSENYGKYLSKSEVESYVRPSNETTSLVTSWLSNNNVSYNVISPAGDMFGFSIPVSQANELLAADYQTFQSGSGSEAIRTLNYSLPETLKGHITTVHPTVSFPNAGSALARTSFELFPARKRSNSNSSADVPQSCNSSVTPTCLQDLYGVPTTPASQTKNYLGVPALINQYANKEDLKEFLDTYRPDMNDSASFTMQSVNGGQNSQNRSAAGTEASLDIQYTVGLATNVPVVFFPALMDNSTDQVNGFIDTINYILNMTDPPAVLSTSYGFNEGDISKDILVNLCNSYMQLGARGTSVIFGSGDGAVAGLLPTDTCTDGKFNPTFPSGCRNVTSVGATTGISPEIAANFTTGGFSNYFDRPSYQSDAVSSYLTYLGDTNSGRFNASGRAFPDVSSQGYYIEIVVNGNKQQIWGTSASTPIFASTIALLNDELVSAGKSTLGFLNPWLYKNAHALTDITSGNNPACNTSGFEATDGWDAITGLGTPKYSALRTAASLS